MTGNKYCTYVYTTSTTFFTIKNKYKYEYVQGWLFKIDRRVDSSIRLCTTCNIMQMHFPLLLPLPLAVLWRLAALPLRMT